MDREEEEEEKQKEGLEGEEEGDGEEVVEERGLGSMHLSTIIILSEYASNPYTALSLLQ